MAYRLHFILLATFQILLATFQIQPAIFKKLPATFRGVPIFQYFWTAGNNLGTAGNISETDSNFSATAGFSDTAGNFRDCRPISGTASRLQFLDCRSHQILPATFRDMLFWTTGYISDNAYYFNPGPKGATDMEHKLNKQPASFDSQLNNFVHTQNS